MKKIFLFLALFLFILPVAYGICSSPQLLYNRTTGTPTTCVIASSTRHYVAYAFNVTQGSGNRQIQSIKLKMNDYFGTATGTYYMEVWNGTDTEPDTKLTSFPSQDIDLITNQGGECTLNASWIEYNLISNLLGVTPLTRYYAVINATSMTGGNIGATATSAGNSMTLYKNQIVFEWNDVNQVASIEVWGCDEIPSDTQGPSYSNLGNNGTGGVYYNSTVAFSVDLANNEELSGYKFAHNLTGSFINSSFTKISGMAYHAEYLLKADISAPARICGEFWFNDTANNQNQSDISCFDVIPILEWIQPLNNSLNRGNPLNFNFTFDFNAVACFLCLNLTGDFSCPANISVSSSSYINATTFYNFSDGLQNYYRFEEGTGSNIIDSRGNSNSTNINAVYQSSKGSNNTGNYSLQFNGVNQYVNNGIVGGYERTNSFSVSFWIKTSLTPVASSILVGKIDNVGYRGWEIFQTNLGINFALLNAISNYIHVRATNFTINNGVWHFIVATYDGTSSASGTKIYIDNVLQTKDIIKDNLGGTILTAQTFKIGADSTSSAYFNGYLDEVMIYNKSLSQDEVNNIYANGGYSNYTVYTNVTVNGSLTPNTNNTISYTFPPDTVKNYQSFINCHNGVDVNSSFLFFNYDNDFTAPTITLFSPNSTYNDTYNIDIWVNFTTSEYSTCTFNLTNFTLIYSNGSVFSYVSNNSLSAGYHAMIINCTDSSGNSAKAYAYFTKDFNYPYIDLHKPVADEALNPYNGYFWLNVSFRDETLLYNYNITIYDKYDDVFFNSTALIGGAFYNYTKKFYMSQFTNDTYRLYLRTCDAHTSKEIQEVKDVIKKNNYLEFQMKGGTTIKIESLSGNEVKAESKKLKDRYSFDFSYSKKGTRKYKIGSNSKVVYLPDSPFKAHFVVGDSYWVDFENSGKTSVYLEDGVYIVESDYEGNDISFNSIGELNCIEQTTYFTIGGGAEEECPLGICLDLQTTGGMILIFTIILLYLGLMFLGFTFNNMGFAGFGFIVGIVLGLILAQFHIFLMLMFIFTNVGILISFGKKNR